MSQQNANSSPESDIDSQAPTVSLGDAHPIHDAGSGTDTSSASTTDSNEHSQTPPSTPLAEVIQRRKRIPFAGLTQADTVDLPDELASSTHLTPDAEKSFLEVIDELPEAEGRELRTPNSFVGKDGNVAEADLRAALDGTPAPDAIGTDPADIGNAEAVSRVPKKQLIVDPRREALAALGYDIGWDWQVASSSYQIIQPSDIFYPAHDAFVERDCGDQIIGWAELKEFGGWVDIYILFADKTLSSPSDAPHTTDDSEDDDGGAIYLGMRTGYGHTGRSLFMSTFGYDARRGVRLYRLGERRHRRHTSRANDAAYERSQGRSPYVDWFEESLSLIEEQADDLAQMMEVATQNQIDFDETPFDVTTLLTNLGIPEAYAEETAEFAHTISPDPDDSIVTMWGLFQGLTLSLENDYKGDDRTNTTFLTYADVAKKFLTQPRRQLELAYQNHSPDEDDDRDSTQQRLASLDEIDAVSTDDELGITEKDLSSKDKADRARRTRLVEFE